MERKAVRIAAKAEASRAGGAGRRKPLAAAALRIWECFLQLLFPRRCPVCDDIVTPMGEKICPGCLGKLRPVSPPWCMKCGKKLPGEGEYCSGCMQKRHDFVRGRGLYEYGSAAISIYRFKYGNRQEYGDFFGEQMAECLGDFVRSVRPDALIPVPLHRKRLAARGYNQAQLLAEAMGRRLGLPVRSDFLIRVKNTRPLKSENPEERQNNLKKAFNIARNDVKLKRVILVDDIYTTGSTVDEAARTLKAAGAEEVYFVALACGEAFCEK